MMNNVLHYKGYQTTVRYVVETQSLRGCIEGINDYVDFECYDAKHVEKEFHKAVDDYLNFCAEVGKEPEKEYKGQFNVRINPDLHRRLAFKAAALEESINKVVGMALEEYLG